MSLSFNRIHKESCFLFQLGETLNPELQIITSVFSKVIHRGEYHVSEYREGKRKTLRRPFLKSRRFRRSWRSIAVACISLNDVITFSKPVIVKWHAPESVTVVRPLLGVHSTALQGFCRRESRRYS